MTASEMRVAGWTSIQKILLFRLGGPRSCVFERRQPNLGLVSLGPSNDVSDVFEDAATIEMKSRRCY